MLAGRDDEATAVPAETIAGGIPGARHVIFEHNAHFPFIEEAERYLSVLDRFLTDVEASDE